MPMAFLRTFAICLLLLPPLLAQAQIAFRAAATGTALVPTFRAATTSGVTYRGSATTPAGNTVLTPVYRAAASASAASGVLTLTINRPAGTLENDVMVAAIGVSGNAPVITPPAGWTLVRRMTNANANANSLAVYIKVATAAEPANYAWTFSASGGAAGGIQAFYNVDILTPVDAEDGQTTASATSHATPGIVTTVPNTMLVTAYTFSSSRGWNNPPLVPAAPAVTERIDVRSNGNNNTGQSTAAHQGLVAAAGAVPALTASTAVAVNSADVGNTHVMALRPALRVPRLAATSAGDFMVAAVGVQPSTATVTAPAGWTQVNRINNAGPTSNALIVYYKFAGAAEPASYLWQLSGASAAVAGIQTYAGVDAATPVDAQAGAATASSLTHAAPAIATTVDNAMLVGHYTFASSATWTPQDPPGPPVAMTESYDVASQAAGPAGQSLEGTRTVQAAAGGSAAYASLASANADAGAAHMMALRPSASSVTIPLPGGTAANDVLIASIGVAWSGVAAPVVTPPAGWTLVRQVDNNSPTRNSLAVFRRVAAAGEPSAYTFGVTNGAYMVGGIQCFYNVDTATPIDAEAGQATPSGRDHATPAIATTVPNTLLVGSYTYASSQAWTPQTPPTPAMTESYDRPSGPAGNTGQSIEGTRLLQAAAGAVPAYTSRAAGGAPTYDRGNTHILALRSANPRLVINVPAGTVANDVMIASIGVAWSGTVAPVATPPAGWTLVRQINNATATRNSLFVYRRVAGGAEPASYTWDFTNYSFATGGIQSFSGADTTSPIDVENGAATASALTHATPSVNTTVANAMLVTSHTYASSGTWTPPAGMTESVDVAAWAAPNALGQSTEGSYVLQPAAGATGAKTATASASADQGNAHILALRPLPVIPTPSSFNAFEPPTAPTTCATMPVTTIAGPIRTKITGTGHSLCVVALDGVPQILTGFSADVRVEVLARDTVGALGADGCPRTNVGDPPVTVLSNVSPVALTSGRALVAFPAEASARRDVRIRISYPTTSPTVTRCSTDNYAIRPLALAVSSTANADATGTSVSATPVFKAGANFSLTATALARYNGTPATDATKVGAHTGAVQTGSLGGSFGDADPATGVATGTFTYSEVGYFNFAVNGVYDDTFTAVDQPGDCTDDFSNTLVGGKYGCKFGNTAATSYFGRFIPDRFGLTTFASDSLIDRSDINTGASETCTSSFTYMGEDFKTRFELSARNASGTVTQNYTGGHAKFVLATWSNYAFTGSGGTLEQGSVTPSGAWGSTPGNFGIAVVTATHRVQRPTASPSAPAGPYTGFAVSAQPAYSDDTLTVSLPASTQVHTGNTEIRYGRLRLQNALGSELRALPVPVWAEYWNGTVFTRNTQDSCTPNGAVALSGAAPCTLTPAVGGVGTALSSGAGTLTLAAPGVRGCADMTMTVPDWLKGRWSGATYTQNPSARATFGVFKDRVLYRRENF